MEIYQIQKELVLSSRLADMGHHPVKVLKNMDGTVSAAMDPIGCKEGDWVFTIANSAARDAAGAKFYLTDLTVGGIIDNWKTVTEGRV
jgi:ethanolamine utilization protein EutN